MRLVLASVCALLVPLSSAAQDGSGRDSTFEAEISGAWAEATNYDGAERDSLWRALAGRLFSYYEAHPETPTGLRAGENAFVMWGNTSAADAVDLAMTGVDDGSGLWAEIVSSVQSAYGRSGQYDDYEPLLRDLAGRVTHPDARRAVSMSLGRLLLESGRDGEARPHFESVLALRPDSLHRALAGDAIHEIDRLGIGMEAPDFEARTLSGDSLRLSDLRGRVVLLDFWASWCGPCLPEIDHLVDVYAAHDPSEFEIVAVSLDEAPEDAASVVEERSLRWIQVWQEGEWAAPVARLFNVHHLPRTVLIDRDGTIVSKDDRGEAIGAAVAALLDE